MRITASRTIFTTLVPPLQHDLINFYGPGGSFRSYSLWQLFSEPRVIPEGYFKDKVVFLGFASDLRGRGFTDKEILEVTAPGGDMYGVEIHATIAGNIIENKFISRISPVLESLLIVLAIFVMTFSILFMQPQYAASVLVGTACIWAAATFVAFKYFLYFLPGFMVITGSIVQIFAIGMFTIALIAQRELEDTKRKVGLST